MYPAGAILLKTFIVNLCRLEIFNLLNCTQNFRVAGITCFTDSGFIACQTGTVVLWRRWLQRTLQTCSFCSACAPPRTETLSAERSLSTGAPLCQAPGNHPSWPPLRQSALAGQLCSAPRQVMHRRTSEMFVMLCSHPCLDLVYLHVAAVNACIRCRYWQDRHAAAVARAGSST